MFAFLYALSASAAFSRIADRLITSTLGSPASHAGDLLTDNIRMCSDPVQQQDQDDETRNYADGYGDIFRTDLYMDAMRIF